MEQGITKGRIREDLKEIRCYYSLIAEFEKCAKTVKPVEVLKTVERYNEVMQNAPARLYILYVSLYIQNNTQTALAEEWGFSREYVKDTHNRLVDYLHKALN